MKAECANCRWWEILIKPVDTKTQGLCKHASPYNTEDRWPITDTDCWCGEFQWRKETEMENIQPISNNRALIKVEINIGENTT